MALINYTPTDTRASIYGKTGGGYGMPAPDPRGRITQKAEWFGKFCNDPEIAKFVPMEVKGNTTWTRIKRKVRNIETGEIYESVVAAAKVYGVSTSTMTNRAKKLLGFEYVDAPVVKRVIDKKTGKIYEGITHVVYDTGYSNRYIRNHLENRVNNVRFSYVD
jgi:hypothetical protein